MQKIVTFLWFNDRVEEAVDLYVSLFKDAKILHTTRLTESEAKMAGKKAGDVSAIDFELNGQNFSALNGGPMYQLTEATSIQVHCKDQEEIDKFWNVLAKDSQVVSCGWVTDKFGLTWQIIPNNLDEMLRDPDPAKANRVSETMLSMDGKLDIGELEKAYRGK